MQALRLASVLALLAAASGCGGSGGGSGVAVAVSLTKFGFEPSSIKVRVGASVTFTNNDTASHTVNSPSCPDLNGSALGPGKSYTVGVGSAARNCTILDTEAVGGSYTGVIIVAGAG